MLPKVAFVFTHNAKRSQIAEALGRHLASDVFESYSGGTEVKSEMNPDAVRLMKEMYGVDMEIVQKPKLVSALPPVDIVVATGCGEACPFLPCRYMEHWEFDDTVSQGDEALRQLIHNIEEKVLDLKERVKSGVVFEEVMF